MKIAYLINHQIHKNDGVTKKIAAQAKSWNNFGHNVKVFCITRKVGESILNANQYPLRSPIFGRLNLEEKLIQDLLEFKPDLVYLRYDIWSRTVYYVIKKYATIAELNTLDVDEYWHLLKKEKTAKALLRYLGYLFLRRYLFKNFVGLVAVTHEIGSSNNVKSYKLPTKIIPNGVTLDKDLVIKRNSGASKQPQLFFIATPNQPWHGVDFILEIAKKIPEYVFHIVGIDDLGGPNNVIWHGYLDKEEYLEILRDCDLCIGSLALFRNNMKEACPLKVREYLSCGFPAIVGYDDTAFINEKTPEFILKIDLEKFGVTAEIIEQIRDFTIRIRNKTVLSSELGAINLFSLEKNRIRFMMEITSRK